LGTLDFITQPLVETDWLAAHLALYDASWEEWGSDPTRPIVR